MSSNHWVYVTNPATETVHLIDFDQDFNADDLSTLCGTVVDKPTWIEGDETVSGVATTCRSCLRIGPTHLTQGATST